MITDSQLQFSDAQALTVSAASTNTVNLKATSSRLFTGEPMVVVITVDVAAKTSDANETYAFALQCDDADAFGSATALASRTIDKALLTAGSKHTIPVPAELDVEQYLRIYYTLGGTNPTVTVTAELMPANMVDQKKEYPDNITIS